MSTHEEGEDKMSCWNQWSKAVSKKINWLKAEVTRIGSELSKLTLKLEPLLDEHDKTAILMLLRKESQPRSFRWIQRRIGRYPGRLLMDLEDAGLIEHTKRGHHNMYAIKELGE